MRKLLVFGMIAGWLGAANSLGAEPSASIRRLMNEPVSAFDWGLFRLRGDLQEDLKFDALKELRPSKAYVEYKSNTNRLVIGLFVYPKQNFLKDVPPKDLCKNVTSYVRRFLNTDLPKHMRAQMGISKYFETESFRMLPEKLMEEIEAITSVKVNVGGGETNKPTKTLTECESLLIGEGVIFNEQPAIQKQKQ